MAKIQAIYYNQISSEKSNLFQSYFDWYSRITFNILHSLIFVKSKSHKNLLLLIYNYK